MFIKTYACAVQGIAATTISIEVNVTRGIRFFIVGLADNAVRESQQRIETAIVNTGFKWPNYRIVINLAPADMRKEGSHFDLPLALGILAASGQLSGERLGDYLCLGELSLDGTVVPARGVLPMALEARERGFRGVVIPLPNRGEAMLVDGLDVVAVPSLAAAVAFLDRGERPKLVADSAGEKDPAFPEAPGPDFSDVRGQEFSKRAMLVAAAGGHNISLVGPPGAGKTMLSMRLPSILPPMSKDEALQTTRVHSVAGLTGRMDRMVSKRPFRAPHHTISNIALIGGGTRPRPGEISLAHNGVLFLDELPEFRRQVLEVLRQPLEEGVIRINRANYSLEYPADFMLVTSMNPCPCGYYTHEKRACECRIGDILRYRARISGPLLDRIDLHIEVRPVAFKALDLESEPLSSAAMLERVVEARRIQELRFQGAGFRPVNARMDAAAIRRFCMPDRQGRQTLEKAMESYALSARAHQRILKVARTIADLDGSRKLLNLHISEALNYRGLDAKQSRGSLV
ncbi:MAG: magnesium chelatase [Bacteroidetes bacterium]|nr:MAG: magnesium chelatase [Bacteroidota bacterium]